MAIADGQTLKRQVHIHTPLKMMGTPVVPLESRGRALEFLFRLIMELRKKRSNPVVLFFYSLRVIGKRLFGFATPAGVAKTD